MALANGVPGWEDLHHGGLLLDGTRLAALGAEWPVAPLCPWVESDLRRRTAVLLNEPAAEADRNASAFVSFVLEQVCGFDGATGAWRRGSNVAAQHGRRAVTGEVVKPRQLWTGVRGARLPVFVEGGGKLGVGKGRRVVSQVLGWLRAGNEHLALVTNGRQFRLVFAGLDFDASCQWDASLWFQEGELAPQVAALRFLLRPELWTPPRPAAGDEAQSAPLLQAIRDTRKGQAELSEVLGERVREAVELLIQSHGEALRVHCAEVAPADIYRAACRVAMRLVIVLFAESRDLLPRDNALYHGSYGLHGLFERLEREAVRGAALGGCLSAWPRVLALFRLVHEGSHFPDLPVPPYGGELFAPASREDGLGQALAVFESACFEGAGCCSDSDVYDVLKLLTRTTVRIRQGRASTTVAAPVDFSDLSSEYIGIVYEGVLDYELKLAPPNDPVIFLAIGDQPALPLSRLEAMPDDALQRLFESMKKPSATSGEDAPETPEEPDSPDEDPHSAAQSAHADMRQHNRTRAETWARRAAQVAGLVPAKRHATFEEMLAATAKRLVARVVLPGEWYLVRWGGTRKGSGSFYTRPGLAVPTVQRTLRPLAFNPPPGKHRQPNSDAPPSQWTPKSPEEILSLKVADPACGSGTFPLAALRFLTDALYLSLQHHQRIETECDAALVHLLRIDADGAPASERLQDELIPCRVDDDEFEPRLKAVLRRHVVERCIYAVDLDPLAVELCRLSLWIETMDRTLPFGFLDHKVKCGNALIGAWLDQFAHYPAMAWKHREGGDKSHRNGVHFPKNARGQALRTFVKERLTPDLALLLRGADLFQEDLLQDASSAHDETLQVLSAMHAMPVQDAAARERTYRKEFEGSPAWQRLKTAMDLWCACWFWPPNELDCAPLPRQFATPSAETQAVGKRVAKAHRFFHWELEFPDVFDGASTGFNALLGNPPWENSQANPEEFFSNVDPLFRTYGRLDKQRRQTTMFEDVEQLESDWLDYVAGFKNLSNWIGCRANPFGDPSNSGGAFPLGKGGRVLHDVWRLTREQGSGFADPKHPFRYQQGRLFTYKLFMEQCLALLRAGGRCGVIVPSGIYSDAWSQPLRDALIQTCRWEWLFGIENRDRVFPIHRSFKFNPIVFEKGSTTVVINTAFMRRRVSDWERADAFAIPLRRDQIERFSPKSHAILEVLSEQDVKLLEKIYDNSVPLGDEGPGGWGVRYRLEFMMNTDARLFPPRPQWEAKGYRPDEYSRWLLGDWRPIEELWAELGVDPAQPVPGEVELEDWLFDRSAGPERRAAEARLTHGHLLKPGDVARTAWRVRCARPPYDVLPVQRAAIPAGVVLSREADAWIREDRVQDVALPLYEGRMIGQFDSNQKGWVSGKGRRAVWRDIPWERKHVEPQFLMALGQCMERLGTAMARQKLAVMDVTSSTNVRTMIAAPVAGVPCGHSIGVLNLAEEAMCVPVGAFLNSFVYDFCLRVRFTGLHTSWFILDETPFPKSPDATLLSRIQQVGESLQAKSALSGIRAVQSVPGALTEHERTRTTVMLDALAAQAFGIDERDLAHILRDCDFPTAMLRSASHLDPKGFWRLDSDKEPELRRTILTQVAFRELGQPRGASRGGDDWLLPETLRLADYGLGHDSRAQHQQPLATRLGARFHDWQLAQSAEEANRERRLHARNVLGELEYVRLLRQLGLRERRRIGEPVREVAEERAKYEGDQTQDEQPDIFK